VIRRCRALLACVLPLSLLVWTAPVSRAAAHPFPRFGAGCVRDDFASGEAHVRAERCGPASGSAVVVLHGCGGFSTFDHRLATDLPAFGIATLYVDYFAPTPPPGTRGFCGGGRHGVDPFPAWQRVAVDAARLLRRQYAHVGAVGWSLGAGVALATAEERHVFDAVAAFSAIAAPPTLAGASSLPPTIFLDGGTRDIVPPANARALYAAAHAAGVAAALYVYGNGTHDWPGRQGELGRARAAAFLRRYLGR
jgi:dienelactone hydrolase